MSPCFRFDRSNLLWWARVEWARLNLPRPEPVDHVATSITSLTCRGPNTRSWVDGRPNGRDHHRTTVAHLPACRDFSGWLPLRRHEFTQRLGPGFRRSNQRSGVAHA